jgi:hypothetical protein
MQCLKCFVIRRCDSYGNCYYEQPMCISIPCATQPGPPIPIPEPGPVEMSSNSPAIMSYHNHPPGSSFCAQQCQNKPDMGACIEKCMNELWVTSPITQMSSYPDCFTHCMLTTGGNFYTCQNMCGHPHYQ